MRQFLTVMILGAGLAFPTLGAAQQVAFGGLSTDTKAPVEITSDSLQVDQSTGEAVFRGDVLVVQSDMRLKAAELHVEYGETQSEINKLIASGGVTLVSQTDAAESQDAVYDVRSGNLVMTGNVLLTQGKNALSGNKLTVDMTTGTGQMDGRVRTILAPGGQ
ncbi:lipopolysaccharide transport periplasmic protein LptA [Thioclava litoralis]|uniref:Lipopolysaccharide transport periplasmic protein LptA n=1 Tax=Thioclava litoralis TaxID=3076557 RepID=A0ABZ1DV54_9RHOB|nr:lipopolysaccharide transport periplasmic protein LptA [Thioclava sp. FTW29]